ncbi:biotin--[acetyl-CoA-carboxylase] ligase [Helicobacter suis]|uniref:biotin--[acetyl-CoA-carboxylase] ligase n=1 Tax=Helicobacter suis TaxID=104628 RepID=UPI000CF0AB92|nr:biotin--[acetyl-CoA-carboxylase] ligase [Helicobacter suis]
MKILYFKTLPSTQLYLVEQIKKGGLNAPVCVWARYQSAGVGSRAQKWESVKRALTFSFAWEVYAGVPMQSWSLYFGYLFKEGLHDLGKSEVWLKWPNDLYKERNKIGGVMTQIYHNTLICGIGLNLESKRYGALDVCPEIALYTFLEKLETKPSWQDIYSAYCQDFTHNHQNQFFKHGNDRISLQQAQILEDGGLLIAGNIYHANR